MAINWDARRKAEEAFPATVAAIAAHLPGAWTSDQRTPQAVTLTRADGLELGFWFSGERIEVKPRPPTMNGGYRSLRDWGVIDYKATGPEATVAIDRKPAAVAGDVVRKVLTPYGPLFANIMARKREQETQQDAARTLAIHVATRLELTRDLDALRNRSQNEGERGYNFHIPIMAEMYGTIDIQSYGKAEVRLRSLTPAQLDSLLDWMIAQKVTA